MFRLIFLLILLAAVAYLISRFSRLSVEEKKRYLKLILIMGLVALMLVLALTGRLNWLVAAFGLLLPLLPKAAKLLFAVWPRLLPFFRRYQQNKQSSMQTQFIWLQVDLITGELKGEVLQGRYKGQKLQSMSVQQLLELLDECKQHDMDSALMLRAFLDRTQPGWSGGRAEADVSRPVDTKMSTQQAREVLGVSETASKEEIVGAHKRLMQKLHPDRGGSDYLAQQINQARDILLKSL